MNTMRLHKHYLGAIVVLGLLGACAVTSESPETATTSNDESSLVTASAKTKANKKVIATDGTVIKQSGKEALICRKIKPTGTRFAETWCLTQAEWSGLKTSGKKTTDKLQRGGMIGQPGGGGG